MRYFYSTLIGIALLMFLLLCGCGSGKSNPVGSDGLSLQEITSQLDVLPVPAGMSAEDFHALRQAFAAQLAASGKQRWLSAAPSDSQNQVSDLALAKIDDFSATASWTYTNVGDYDQNSEVNISDLTPLGSHLGETSADAGWPAGKLADGDGNNECNISDLTPLGAHLLNSVDGYMIQSTLTPLDEGSWQPVGLAMFEESVASPTAARSFAVTVGAISGQSFRVLPFVALVNGIPSLPFAYTGQAGPELSFEERQSIFDQITEKMDNLTETTSDGQDAEIATFIAGLPHIVEAGFFEGNAWGRFDDGIPLVVCKNHAPASGQQISSIRDSAAAAAKSASGYTLPEDNTGHALWGYGAGSQYTDPTQQLATILDEAGYETFYGPDERGTLAIMNGGFLYLDAPAGFANSADGLTLYWIGVADDYLSDNEVLFKQDLSAGLLGYMFATDAAGVGKWQYCFCHKFVEQKPAVKFSAQSFVFLNTPGSGMAQEMIGAFQSKGASLVLGWTSCVPNDITYAAALHIFDRMLGANVLGRVEDPPIRPFSLQEIIFDMQARGVSAGQPIMYPLAPANPYDTLIRFYSPVDPFNAFSQLAPSIEYMTVTISEDGLSNRLELSGDFGDDPENEPWVFVGDGKLDLVSFDAGSIVATLTDNGPGSFGEVQVLVNGIASNTRYLTEWRGTIDLTAIGPGSLKHKVVYNLHMRGDLHDYRTLPDSPLVFGTAGDGKIPLISAPDSYAEVDSSGVYVDGTGAVTTWTNAGDTHASNVYGAALDDFMNMGGYLDMAPLKFTLFMPCQGDFHSKKVNQDLTIDHDEDRLFYIEIGGAVSVPELFTMVLNDDYSIQAGAVSKTQGEITYQALWPKMIAQSPPPDDAPR